MAKLKKAYGRQISKLKAEALAANPGASDQDLANIINDMAKKQGFDYKITPDRVRPTAKPPARKPAKAPPKAAAPAPAHGNSAPAPAPPQSRRPTAARPALLRATCREGRRPATAERHGGPALSGNNPG